MKSVAAGSQSETLSVRATGALSMCDASRRLDASESASISKNGIARRCVSRVARPLSSQGCAVAVHFAKMQRRINACQERASVNGIELGRSFSQFKGIHWGSNSSLAGRGLESHEGRGDAKTDVYRLKNDEVSAVTHFTCQRARFAGVSEEMFTRTVSP